MTTRLDADVIIIGAGAAGLAAAVDLAMAGRRCIILEAADRVGGRILSIHDDRFPFPLDLGAEFIHGKAKPTWKLAKAAAADPYETADDHRQLLNRKLAAIDFSRQIKPVMERLRKVGGRRRDMSFAEFLDRHASEPELKDSRKLARAFVEGFDAAPVNQISAKSLAAEWRGVGDVGSQPQFRLGRGYRAILDHLRQELAGHAVPIELGTRATMVRWRRGHVDVLTASTRGRRTYRAAAAIITIPLSAWHASSLRFDPAIPAKHKAATKLGFGSVVKAVLHFREPFWEDDAIARTVAEGKSLAHVGFLHHAQAAFPTWWTTQPRRSSVLTAWAGGPKADALAGRSEMVIVNIALRGLADLLQQNPKRLRSLLIAARAHDWSREPFIHGAYSYERVSAGEARSQLAQPIRDTLFFAGEATSQEQAATVAGALESGQRAAKEARRLLRG